MKYLIPFLLLTLTACAGNAPVRPVVPEKETVSIPPEDLRQCEPLPRMEERPYDQLDIATFFQSWMTVYDRCSGKQARLADTIKKAFNLQENP